MRTMAPRCPPGRHASGAARLPTQGAGATGRPSTEGHCLAVLALLAAASGCFDDTSAAAGRVAPAGAAEPNPERRARRLGVVGTDFQSTTISTVDLASGKVLVAGLLGSGSASGAVSAALSGDVVLSSLPWLDGSLVLVDRGNAVLTWVRGQGVHRQFNVSTGFGGNPQDCLQVSAAKAYVSRAQANPKPTPGPGDCDEGDDLLLVDLTGPRIAGRVALGPHSSLPGSPAFPGRLAWDGARVWVPLASLAADFKSIGPGRVVAVDGLSDNVLLSLDLDGLSNCTDAAWLAGRQALAVLCAGFFPAGPRKQAAESGLALVGGSPPQATVVLRALTLGRPFSLRFGLIDERLAVLATVGDLQTAEPDRLWLGDLETGDLGPLGVGGGAFAIGGIFGDPARRRAWVAEAAHPGGDLRVFAADPQGQVVEEPSIHSNPGGLGAWEVGGF